MARYSQIISTLGPNPNTDIQDKQPRYRTVKYPEISRDFSDLYVFTRVGDRYDTLAQSYYSDSSLWWVISIANSSLSQNSYFPPLGVQIRIPQNVGAIQISFEKLNNG